MSSEDFERRVALIADATGRLDEPVRRLAFDIRGELRRLNPQASDEELEDEAIRILRDVATHKGPSWTRRAPSPA